MTTKAEQAAIGTWTKALARLQPDVLDRIIKRTVRDFEVDLKDPEDRADYQHALDAQKSGAKAQYVMGFSPVFGDTGIVAYLTEHSARWGIDVEPEKTPRRQGKTSGDAAHAAAGRRKAGSGRVRATRATRTVEAGGKRKPRGVRAVLYIPGDAFRTAEAMGIRKVPDEKRVTVLKTAKKFEVHADAANKKVFIDFVTDATTAVVGFVRRRLANDARILSRVVIVDTKTNAAPELTDRVVERCGLKATRSGYRILPD